MRRNLPLYAVVVALLLYVMLPGCPPSASDGTNSNRFFGLYRGVVIDNTDPLALGRVRVDVPDVSGTDTIWAIRSVDAQELAAGENPEMRSGAPVGSSAWVAFEAGDPSRPVCVGYFWQAQ